MKFEKNNAKCTDKDEWASQPMLHCENSFSTLNNDEVNNPIELLIKDKFHLALPKVYYFIPLSPDYRIGINEKHKRIFVDRVMFGTGHDFAMEGVVIK